MASETTASGATPGPAAQPELRRAIGPKLLLFFVIGDILGTGIYALTGTVAGKVGGALWVPFLLAFLVAFLTAFSYLELVGKYPKAAGAALYTNRAFGIPFLTFMVAFAVMSSGLTSASSAAQAFSGTYLQQFVTVPAWVVAIGFIVLLALVNYRGVGESVKANVVLTCVELTGLLIVIVIGVLAVVQGKGEPGRLLEFNTQGQTTLFAITSATSLAFFAMVGFEDSVNMAEECQDPVRIFPRSMLMGMGAAGLIYLLVALASSLLVPVDQLKGAGGGALLKVVQTGAENFPLQLFAFIGLFAVSNSALINMLMASRLVYGMANERIIPKQFGRVHPMRRTPWVSILFTSAIAVVLVSTVDLALLGGTTSLLLLVVFTIVNIAVLVLRREKAPHKHFRTPTAVPILGAITCAYLASPLSGRPAKEYLIAGVLLLVGLALWGLNRVFLRGSRAAATEPGT
ncbi:amino acid/polyamine/organocation transporter, APC superfamily [Streptoalloteichus tenebrarius]|uniref:Amino acid/polyamine/organocation transporter, APC superfamily n=1 Tax=Streptoalloteichus tenebrarius (strain ATCC 17920 / DSM 40477 / JCM 4838 / CBS 697.72 / NBRC 16177 / NCIMB 11028 / NRRL B-12390 / A12253. 1 / ISP 5477) TaxID=1933 RepID=A0ABT1HVM3_STRSD|nr:APC family permease [Streptoalloteichus tenebrarius]MCP2259558.1 amino acid/polyamine/organocation transporter, APC superfamily [Streptoalloteichus tenebrarius]BFF01359.1 APC family permease [Streptoalloteichus tenebrarius]